MKWMVNRADAWGQYMPLDQRPRGKARTRRGELTEVILVRHYKGVAVSDLVALHTTSANNTSRWLGIDIDLHGEPDKEVKRRNQKAAKRLYERAKELGFRPLLLSSNGRGGYHLILLFDQPVETPRVFAFGKWLLREWQELGLPAEPEVFPKQPRLEGEKGYGNFLRLPGRHHTLNFYTKVWTGEKWVAGKEGVGVILGTKGVSPERIPAEVAEVVTTTQPSVAEPAPGIPPEHLRHAQKRALALIRTVKAVQAKGGDKATWTVALYLVKDFGFSVEQALPVMKEWNATHCQPPWSDDDLLHKLRRAERAPGERGRLLEGTSAGVVDAAKATTTEGSQPPFLMEVPDFILADWDMVRPKILLRKAGRPPSAIRPLRGLLLAAVSSQRSSRICFPDVVMAQLLVRDGNARRWPQKGWRRGLRQVLKRIAQKFKPLQVRFRSACPSVCPLHGRTDVPHRHLWLTLPEPQRLLGLLHAFHVSWKEHRSGPVYSYDFKGRRSHHPDPGMAELLNKELKQGQSRLWSIYLPAWLLGPAVLKPGPCNVLKALTRELTRSGGTRDRPAKAQVISGSAHAVLDKAKKYIAFNGNGGPHYRGMGYRIKTWMGRAGYAADPGGTAFWDEARRFLSDLATLEEPFGLVAGGYRGDKRQWHTLDVLIGMTRSVEGRKWLAKCRLKVFGPEDYLVVWRQHFARALGFSTIPGGRDEDAVGTVQTFAAPSAIQSPADLDAWMRQRGLTNRALAKTLGVSVGLVGSQRSGLRPWSADFQRKLSALFQPSAEESSL